MSTSAYPRPGNVSLDDLIALNDEMIALARAGVPLEQGLGHLGKDLPRRLGKIAGALAARMEAGQSLWRAISDEGDAFPPVYRAVVQAGIKSGRLSTALEGLSTSSRRIAELRRMVGLAAMYPLVVLLLAYGCFCFFITNIAPSIVVTYQAARVGTNGWVDGFAALSQSIATWGPWPPIVLVVLTGAWWYRSGKAMLAEPHWSRRWLGWLPSFSPLLKYSRTATFAEVLALLVRHHVPLDEGVVLAADASGDAGMQRAAKELAERIRGGRTADTRGTLPKGFPPLLGWVITSGRGQDGLVATLRHTANTYHRRALRLDDWLRSYLPIVFTVAIGGTATVAYALAVMGPWYELLIRLGQPS